LILQNQSLRHDDNDDGDNDDYDGDYDDYDGDYDGDNKSYLLRCWCYPSMS